MCSKGFQPAISFSSRLLRHRSSAPVLDSLPHAGCDAALVLTQVAAHRQLISQWESSLAPTACRALKSQPETQSLHSQPNSSTTPPADQPAAELPYPQRPAFVESRRRTSRTTARAPPTAAD